MLKGTRSYVSIADINSDSQIADSIDCARVTSNCGDLGNTSGSPCSFSRYGDRLRSRLPTHLRMSFGGSPSAVQLWQWALQTTVFGGSPRPTCSSTHRARRSPTNSPARLVARLAALSIPIRLVALSKLGANLLTDSLAATMLGFAIALNLIPLHAWIL